MRKRRIKDIDRIIISQQKFMPVILRVNGFDKRLPIRARTYIKNICLRDIVKPIPKDRRSLQLPVRLPPLSWMGMFHMIQFYYDYFFGFDIEIYFFKRFQAVEERFIFRIDYGLDYNGYYNFKNLMYSICCNNLFIYFNYMLRDLYVIETKFRLFKKKAEYIMSKKKEIRERTVNYVYTLYNTNPLFSVKLRSFLAGYFDLLGNFRFSILKNRKFKFGIHIDLEFLAYLPMHTISFITLIRRIFERNIIDELKPLRINDLDETPVNDYEHFIFYKKKMEIVNYETKYQKKITSLKSYLNRYNVWGSKEWKQNLLKPFRMKNIIDHYNYVHEVFWFPDSDVNKEAIYKENNFVFDDTKTKGIKKYKKLNNFVERDSYFNMIPSLVYKKNSNKYTYRIIDKFVLYYTLIPFFKQYVLRFSTRFLDFKVIEYIMKEYFFNNHLVISKLCLLLELIYCETNYLGNYSLIEIIDIILLNSTET